MGWYSQLVRFTTAECPLQAGNRAQIFDSGEKCYEGPQRSTRLVFECDSEDRLLDVVEESRCKYVARFGTPASCSPEQVSSPSQDSSASVQFNHPHADHVAGRDSIEKPQQSSQRKAKRPSKKAKKPGKKTKKKKRKRKKSRPDETTG